MRISDWSSDVCSSDLLTHQQAADAVGRSRASVSNMLRLTELPESIKKLLDDGKLEMGHARCLLTLEESIAVPLARQASTLGSSEARPVGKGCFSTCRSRGSPYQSKKKIN